MADYKEILKKVSEQKKVIYEIDPQSGKFKQVSNQVTNTIFSDKQLVPKPSIEDVFIKDSYDKFYYNGTNSALYIYGIMVDELTAFSFNASQNDAPLYNYNNKYINVLAPGNFSVMGKIVVNFTETGYLYRLINTGRTDINEGNSLSNMRDRIESSMQKTRWDFHPANDDKTKDNDRKLLRDTLWGKQLTASEKEEFKKKFVAEYDRFFDMALIYGNPSHTSSDGTKNYQVHTIVDAKIISIEQTFQIDETPIQEVYTFIAKRLDKPLNETSTAVQYEESAEKNIKSEKQLRELVENASSVIGRELFNFIVNPYSVVSNIYTGPEIQRPEDLMIFTSDKSTRGGGYFVNASAFIPLYKPDPKIVELTNNIISDVDNDNTDDTSNVTRMAREIVLASMYGSSNQVYPNYNPNKNTTVPYYYINPFSLANNLYILAPVQPEEESFVGSFNTPTVNLSNPILYKDRLGIKNAMLSLENLVAYEPVYPVSDADNVSVRSTESLVSVKNTGDVFDIQSTMISDEWIKEASGAEIEKRLRTDLPLHPHFESIKEVVVSLLSNKDEKNSFLLSKTSDPMSKSAFNSSKGIVEIPIQFTDDLLNPMITDNIISQSFMIKLAPDGLKYIYISIGDIQDCYAYISEFTVRNASTNAVIIDKLMVRVNNIPILRASDYVGQTAIFKVSMSDIFPNKTFKDIVDLIYPDDNNGPKTFGISIKATRFYGNYGTIQTPFAVNSIGTDMVNMSDPEDVIKTWNAADDKNNTNASKKTNSFVPTSSVGAFVRDRFVTVSSASGLTHVNYIPRIGVFVGGYQVKYQLNLIIDEIVAMLKRSITQESLKEKASVISKEITPLGGKTKIPTKDIIESDSYTSLIKERINAGFSERATLYTVGNPKISYSIISSEKTVVVTKQNDYPDKSILDKLLRFDMMDPSTVGGSLDSNNTYEKQYKLSSEESSSDGTIKHDQENAKTFGGVFRVGSMETPYVDPTMYGNIANGLTILGRSLTSEPTADLVFLHNVPFEGQQPGVPDNTVFKAHAALEPLFEESGNTYYTYKVGTWVNLNTTSQYFIQGVKLIPDNIKTEISLENTQDEYSTYPDNGVIPQTISTMIDRYKSILDESGRDGKVANPIEFVSLYEILSSQLFGFRKTAFKDKMYDGNIKYSDFDLVKYVSDMSRYCVDHIDFNITKDGPGKVTAISIKPTGSSFTLEEHITKMNEYVKTIVNEDITANGGTIIPSSGTFDIGQLNEVSTEGSYRRITSSSVRKIYELMLNISLLNQIVDGIPDLITRARALEPYPYVDEELKNWLRQQCSWFLIQKLVRSVSIMDKKEELVERKTFGDSLHTLTLDTFSEPSMTLNAYRTDLQNAKIVGAFTFMGGTGTEEYYRNCFFPFTDKMASSIKFDSVNGGASVNLFLDDNNQNVEELHVCNIYEDTDDKVKRLCETLDNMYFDPVQMDYPVIMETYVSESNGYPSFGTFEWDVDKYSAGYIIYDGGFSYSSRKAGLTDNDRIVLNNDTTKLTTSDKANPFVCIDVNGKDIVAVGLCRNNTYNYANNLTDAKDEFGFTVRRTDASEYRIDYYKRVFVGKNAEDKRTAFETNFEYLGATVIPIDTSKNILQVIAGLTPPTDVTNYLTSNKDVMANGAKIELFIRMRKFGGLFGNPSPTKKRLYNNESAGEEKPSLTDYRTFLYNNIGKPLLGCNTDTIDINTGSLTPVFGMIDINENIVINNVNPSNMDYRVLELVKFGEDLVKADYLPEIDNYSSVVANAIIFAQKNIIEAYQNNKTAADLELKDKQQNISIIDTYYSIRGNIGKFIPIAVEKFTIFMFDTYADITQQYCDSLARCVFLTMLGSDPSYVMSHIITGDLTGSHVFDALVSNKYSHLVMPTSGKQITSFTYFRNDLYNNCTTDYLTAMSVGTDVMYNNIITIMKAASYGLANMNNPFYRMIVSKRSDRLLTSENYHIPKVVLDNFYGTSVESSSSKRQFLITPRNDEVLYELLFGVDNIDRYVSPSYTGICFNAVSKNSTRLINLFEDKIGDQDDWKYTYGMYRTLTYAVYGYSIKSQPYTNRDIIMSTLKIGSTVNEQMNSYNMYSDSNNTVFDNTEFHYFKKYDSFEGIQRDMDKVFSRIDNNNAVMEYLSSSDTYTTIKDNLPGYYSVIDNMMEGFGEDKVKSITKSNFSLWGAPSKINEMDSTNIEKYMTPFIYSDELEFEVTTGEVCVNGTAVLKDIDLCKVKDSKTGHVTRALTYGIVDMGSKPNKEVSSALYLYKKDAHPDVAESNVLRNYLTVSDNEYANKADKIKGLPEGKSSKVGDYFVRIAYDIDL